MFKTMQWSTFHFVMIPLSIIFLPLFILWVNQDYKQYSDYIEPFSWIFFPLLWFFLIKRGISLRRSERAEQVAFLNNSGFYEISVIEAMKKSELYLRCKLQFKSPNQDFSSLTMFQLRLKSFAGIAEDVGTVVGTAKGLSDSFVEGLEKEKKKQAIEDALNPPPPPKKKWICRNCGHHMGALTRRGIHAGFLGNPGDCEKYGKKCVSVDE